MQLVTNLNERTQYFASDDLISQLKSKMSEGDTIVNFAYTDYGGDFFDKVCIDYFKRNYPENFVFEKSYYFGENGFLFGEVASQFMHVTNRYLLGFECIEDHYSIMENEVKEQGIQQFLKDIDRDKFTVNEEIPSDFWEYVDGYCNVITSGLDYSENDIIDKAIETGLITPITEG